MIRSAPLAASLRLSTLVTALVASLVTPAAAVQRRDESWGKVGVSYLQYRTDAVECAHHAETKAPVALAPVDLAFALDSAMPDAQPQADLTKPNLDVSAVIDYAAQSQLHMNKHWRRVAQQLQPALAACLTARGYQRFRLTDEQTAQLKRLETGSRARNVYLWNLAVDPAVLGAQKR